MSGAVTDIDKGYKALFQRLARENQGRVVDVGVLGKEGSGVYEDGNLTVADVASFHEFGQGVPERSFIRAYVDENRSKIEDWLRRMAKRVITGEVKSFDHGLELIGMKIESEIKQRIRDGIPPELSEATLAQKKGKSTPLIDTGQLLSSITHEVRRISEGG
jgi:hypothetical protein